LIIDSSVVVALFLREPDWQGLIECIANTAAVGIGTPTLVETGIVLSARLNRDARPLLARFIQEFEIQPITFGEAHWQEAVRAFGHFGKGRHPAALNFGDCMTYATARLARQPLLFVGDDFSKTDLEIVTWPSLTF